MSIIKNSNNTSRTDCTMRSFHDITLNTASDRTGQLWTVLHYIRFMSTSSAPAYYLPLNSPLYSQDTIQILARIPSSVNGYFFGASTMTISKSGNTVTWTNGSDTATATVTDWENFHLFGFVNGKPMLDLTVLASWTITDSLRASGGAWFGACSGQTDNVSQIDIQRINIYGKASTTATVRQQKAYYPMIRLDANTSLGFFEARRRRYGVNSTGLEDTTNFHTSSSSYTYSKNSDNTPETVTYGLQLDDLHVMFDNGYHDLIPTVCDDGGIDETCGWDADSAADPYALGGKSFAFNLKGFPYGSGVAPGTGVTGELMQGRKPKWSIWNDMIKFGFHVIKTTGSTIAQDRYAIHFNVCKDNKGGWHKPDYDPSDEPKVLLELFDGYNNSSGNEHPAAFSMLNGDIAAYYHNGVCVLCDFDTAFGGGQDNIADNIQIFLLTETSVIDGGAKFKLGNLPLWHKTTAQQIADDENYMAVGGGVMLEWNYNGWQLLASMMEIADEQNVALSSDSSAATKAKFRDNFVTIDNVALNSNLLDIVRFISRLYSPDSWQAVPLRASMALLRERTYNPKEYQVINVSGLVNPQQASLTPTKDRKISTATTNYTKSRFLIGNANAKFTYGGTEYDYCVNGSSKYRNRDIPNHALSYNATNLGNGIPMAFALRNGNTFLSNTANIIVMLEATEAYESDGTSGGVTHKAGDIKRYYRSLMKVENGVVGNGKWVIGSSVYDNDFNSIYTFKFDGGQRNLNDGDNERMFAIFRYNHDFFSLYRQPTGPMTMIMTLYDGTAAPHQYDVCDAVNSAADVDCVSENQFVGVGGTYLVFPSGQPHVTSQNGVMAALHFSCWNAINIWSGSGNTPQQVSTLPNMKVALYRRSCIVPSTLADADNTFSKVAEFSLSNTVRTGTNNNYSCTITAEQYEDFRINPDGTYEKNLPGFYMAITSTATATDALPGDMFRVVITAQ